MINKKHKKMKNRITLTAFVLGFAWAGINYVGNHNLSLALFCIMLFSAIGLWVYFGSGDLLDTMRQTDERQQYIIREARQYTAGIMALILLCGAAFEVLHGKIFGPFIELSSLMGFVFLAAVIVLHIRT
jgi:hypothetical protein